MSRTMFWYIMRDLLRIFLMTSGVLAGIMSFGGLLKPLMEYGLSGSQVSQMLLYFMPATQTYSLPIAALFATTVTYGRLSADNELTACRAVGISYLTLAIPAFVLGLVLALVSLLSLSFVVPAYTLKVENVIFSSLADVVQKNIQRSHQIKLNELTIYADSAQVIPRQPGSDDEHVILVNPMFCIYDQIEEPNGRTRNIPNDFFTASSAQVRIRQGPDQVECSASLSDGVRFPRNLEGSATGGLREASFGPFPLPSPIRENTKFMDIAQLKELDVNPLRSREIRKMYNLILRQEQEHAYLSTVLEGLRANGQYRFAGPSGDTYILSLADATRRLVVSGRGRIAVGRGRAKLAILSIGTARDIRLAHEKGGVIQTVDEAREVVLRPEVDSQSPQSMKIVFELGDVLVNAGQSEMIRQTLPRPFRVATPPAVAAMERDGLQGLIHNPKLKSKEVGDLRTKLGRLHNGIRSELHGRASFAVSCLILVLVGSALGMMFRTGNFLNAFALSSIPALFCIALSVTGQHVAENGVESLGLGLVLIWLGNGIVLILATWLLGRLHRQ